MQIRRFIFRNISIISQIGTGHLYNHTCTYKSNMLAGCIILVLRSLFFSHWHVEWGAAPDSTTRNHGSRKQSRPLYFTLDSMRCGIAPVPRNRVSQWAQRKQAVNEGTIMPWMLRVRAGLITEQRALHRWWHRGEPQEGSSGPTTSSDGVKLGHPGLLVSLSTPGHGSLSTRSQQSVHQVTAVDPLGHGSPSARSQQSVRQVTTARPPGHSSLSTRSQQPVHQVTGLRTPGHNSPSTRSQQSVLGSSHQVMVLRPSGHDSLYSRFYIVKRLDTEEWTAG